LDLLGALVSKSLVVADTSGFEARYRLLNTVRQFGAGKLTAADEVERLRKSLETVTVPIRGRGPTRRRPRAGPSSLTPAELAVVRLVAEGLTNKEIGGHLRVSARTVQTHLAHVFDKLGVRSRREVAYATRGYSSATAADVPTSPAG
jgi:DNA-binding NarL/FixJ family response regulator